MNRSHSECSTGRRAARRLSRADAAPPARGRNRTRQFVCTTRPPRPPLQLVGTGRQHVVWHRTAPVKALQLLANFVRQKAPPAWFYGATVDVVAASDAPLCRSPTWEPVVFETVPPWRAPQCFPTWTSTAAGAR